MLRKLDHKLMGKNNLSWLKALYHFSFSDYNNSENMNFGVLRVLNDDIISGNTGFDMHPHKDMEIITYVVDGVLTHEDSMGNRSKVKRGEIQYMSAGKGVFHSEHNLEDQPIRSLQIWIYPDKKGHHPNYGDYKFNWEDRKNMWLHMVSGKDGDAPVKINQDANFYVTSLDKGQGLEFEVAKNRQAYLLQIEGVSKINEIELNERDALEIIEETIRIVPQKDSHILVIEMKKSNS